MSLRNTTTRFGTIAKFLHWTIAVGLWAMFLFGNYISDLKIGPDNFYLIPRHKAFGILMLALICIRILWRITNRPPTPLPTSAREHLIARTTHATLYALMLATPLFGWIGASATGFSIPFFGLFNVPLLWGEDENIADLFFMFHGFAATTLIVLSLLHLGAALYRHFILRDDTLRRITR